MEIIQYFLVSLATSLGLFAGAIVSYLTQNEQKNEQEYLKKLVLPFRQENIFTLLGIIFAFLSPSRYFFLTATLIFLYGIPVGSFLFTQKNNKELFSTAGIFVLATIAFRIALWEYYAK